MAGVAFSWASTTSSHGHPEEGAVEIFHILYLQYGALQAQECRSFNALSLA